MHSAGLYHYALSCSYKSYSVVMRRHYILDCFTVPYNSTLLKAFNDKVEVMPLYSMLDYCKMEEKYEVHFDTVEDPIVSRLLSNHRVGPLSELFALADNKKIKTINSAPLEYISTYEKHTPKFKKIAVQTEVSYEMPGKGFFQELSSNVLRHACRLNGSDVLLAESSLYYDVLLQKETLELLELYKDHLDKIPRGNIMGISGQYLPSYIICQNNQILKLRSKMKVLQIPDFQPLSKEYMYSRVLLYYPLKPGEKIDSNRLGKHFINKVKLIL